MNVMGIMQQIMSNNRVMGNPMIKNAMSMAQSGNSKGYEEPPYYHMPVNYNDMEYMRDMDKSQGKMYYSEPIASHVSESNYDRAKRHYTETKEMHKGASTEDKEHKMKALDMYIRELSGDISELLNDMTPDERNLLRTKMSNLASKL